MRIKTENKSWKQKCNLKEEQRILRNIFLFLRCSSFRFGALFAFRHSHLNLKLRQRSGPLGLSRRKAIARLVNFKFFPVAFSNIKYLNISISSDMAKNGCAITSCGIFLRIKRTRCSSVVSRATQIAGDTSTISLNVR